MLTVLSMYVYREWCGDCSQTKRKSVSQASDSEKQESEGVEGKDDGREEKRSRVEDTSSSTAEDSTPVAAVTSQKASPPARCNQCRQLLDDPDLRLFPGDHCDAVCHL